MGQADVNVNLWLKDTKRFADLFNAILFHGETVILPENLHPSPETTAVSLQDAQGKNVVKKQYRDIIMNWQDQALLMLLAMIPASLAQETAPVVYVTIADQGLKLVQRPIVLHLSLIHI